MMNNSNKFDVIITGGSYAELAAGMSLGRALKNVLIIDGGMPCNRQTPFSHNFLTRDGFAPSEISGIAKEQVRKYETVSFLDGFAVDCLKTAEGFVVTTETGAEFQAQKLILASGIKDLFPAIRGFAECWGISVIHCPFCHGYEVRNEKTGIFGNGDFAFEFSRLISNWTQDLTVYTNGISTLTEEQRSKLAGHNILINEKEIIEFKHVNGKLQRLVFADNSEQELTAIYAHIPFEHTSAIPSQLGCELTETGHIKVDTSQKTSVEGVYACGDCASPMRSVANAVGTGTFTGAAVSKELITEKFS